MVKPSCIIKHLKAVSRVKVLEKRCGVFDSCDGRTLACVVPQFVNSPSYDIISCVVNVGEKESDNSRRELERAARELCWWLRDKRGTETEGSVCQVDARELSRRRT